MARLILTLRGPLPSTKINIWINSHSIVTMVRHEDFPRPAYTTLTMNAGARDVLETPAEIAAMLNPAAA